jgi:hypothetical protein
MTPRPGRIVIHGVHEDGSHDRTVAQCMRSSSNIDADVQCMTAALELRDAIRRGVNITPEQFYKQVAGLPEKSPPYCLLLNNCKCAPHYRASCNHWRTS